MEPKNLATTGTVLFRTGAVLFVGALIGFAIHGLLTSPSSDGGGAPKSNRPAFSTDAPTYELKCERGIGVVLPRYIKKAVFVVPPCGSSTHTVEIPNPDDYFGAQLTDSRCPRYDTYVLEYAYEEGRAEIQGLEPNKWYPIAGGRCAYGTNSNTSRVWDKFRFRNQQQETVVVVMQFF